MKKSNFVAILMGVIGVVMFALGMCMVLIEEWNSGTNGIILGTAGAIILIAMIFVKKKMDGKEIKLPSKKTVGSIVIGMVGALILGIGMCLSMVYDYMVIGIVIGVVGIIILLLLIPYIKGLK